MTTNNEDTPKGVLADMFNEQRNKLYQPLLEAAQQERDTILAAMQAKNDTKEYDITYFQTPAIEQLDELTRDEFARLMATLDEGLPAEYAMASWCGSLALVYTPPPIPAAELLKMAHEELEQVLKQMAQAGYNAAQISDPSFFVRTSENLYNHLTAKHRRWGIFPCANPLYTRLMAEGTILGVTVEEIRLKTESAGYGPVGRIYLRINV